MSLIFNDGPSALKTSINALAADLKLTPYHNLGFHFDGILSTAMHGLRCLYNALKLSFCVLKLLNPFCWLGLVTDVPTHTLALGISVLTVAVMPVIFLARTFLSLLIGYGESTGSNDYEAESKDFSAACTIW